ncbi:MAG TPA: hypothetical protein VFO94_09375 [Gammaproteobacteria bacterium]|nr:hypothetical protein [Gammaproteobacteria bacterium]
MTLEPEILRRNPQLAALAMLRESAETTIVALCAAHPTIEHALRSDPLPSLDRLADHVVDHAMLMLDALDRYRLLLHDRDHLRGLLAEEDPIF